MNVTALQRPSSLVEGVCEQLAELIRDGSSGEERWLPAELGLASRMRTIGRIGKGAAIKHHARIIDAIKRRDATAARDAMRLHILAAGADMDLDSLKPANPVDS